LGAIGSCKLRSKKFIMLVELAPFLTCPLCGGDLRLQDNALRCPAGHSFDRARQGYVNLLTGHQTPGTADTTEMVQAREDFLSAGHYAPLAERLAERAAALMPQSLIIDAGAGTGYYLRAVLESLPAACGLALDVSKFALRRAARVPRAAAVVWDLWRPLPVKAGSAGLILNVFAPRNGPEFRRVLSDDGVLLVVTPGAEHLAELVRSLGLISVDERKEERLEDSLLPSFRRVEREILSYPLRLNHAEAHILVGMGPSARHLSSQQLRERIGRLPESVRVTASFVISVFRPA
jgi:23S rRNA (guanine745-N1)-methyltransferase